MRSTIIAILLPALLAACGGIPLRSLPRLLQLQDTLLEADPAQFMLAIQVDRRMSPPPGAVPYLQLSVRPKEPGAFEPIDKRLPMQWTDQSASALGLAAPAAGRRWLIYSFPPESQAELSRIQDHFKRIQAHRSDKRGGSLSVGIAQEGVAVNDPALANSRWESWFQTSRRDGFFELWSGTVGSLLKQANAAASSAPVR